MTTVRNQAELNRFKKDQFNSLLNKAEFLREELENSKIVNQTENSFQIQVDRDLSTELLDPQVRPFVDKLSKEVGR